jgi:predicted nucleic acid-binding protein
MDVKELTGLAAISQEELKEITRRLCYFAAKGAQSYVSELIEFLVLHSLAKLPPGAHHTREICDRLCNLIGFQFEYEQVLSALRRLEDKAAVYVVDNHSDDTARFGLEVGRISELAEKHRQQVDFENRIMQVWRDELKMRYPDLSEQEHDALQEDLEAFSLRLYSLHSVESVALYFGEDENVANLLGQMDDDTIRDILPQRDPKLHVIRMYELPRFFKDAHVERKLYIGQQLNQIFLLHMMQLDAKCARLASQAITGGTLYLDTNYIIRLLGIDGPELQSATQRLLELSRGLGYRPVVSPMTVEEYNFKIGALVREARSLPPIAPEVAEAALTVTFGDDFYTHYWKRTRDEKGFLSRQGYYELYKNLDPFLEEYDVAVETALDKEIRSNANALRAEESLLLATLSGYQPSHPSVVEHDAYHRLLILQLRQGHEESSPLQTPFWFLTCDTKLPVYDRRARRKSFRIPFCVLTSHWMQLLRPFAPAVADFDIAQADSLDSPLFRLFPSPPTELIQEIINRMAATERIPSSVIVKIITNDAFVRAFAEESDEAKRNELVQERVLDEVVGLLEEERANLDEKQSSLDNALKDVERKSQNLDRAIEAAEKREQEFLQARDEQERYKRELAADIEAIRASAAEQTEQSTKLVADLRLELGAERSKRLEDSHRFQHEQSIMRATVTRQQKIGLVILAWIACGAFLLAFSPWAKTNSLKWLTLTSVTLTLILTQLILLWGKALHKVILALMIVANLCALVVAVALPLGWDVSGVLIGVLTFVQAAGAVYAIVEYRETSLDSK